MNNVSIFAPKPYKPKANYLSKVEKPEREQQEL